MTEPHYQDDSTTLHYGDCLDVLRELPDSSVDAVVTDPPYGLEFMGRKWDGADGFRRSLNPADVGRDNAFGRTSRTSPEYRAGTLFQEWCEQWAIECLRVLKPGGQLLAFGGTRTWHRLACAVEDAGFEIRDNIAWLYGSGFPKHGGALKPAFEPIVHGRRPLIGTVAANVLEHGTGALNIDGCRVGDDMSRGDRFGALSPGGAAVGGWRLAHTEAWDVKPGRWPANVVLDEAAAAELDRQSGSSTSRIGKPRGAAHGDGWSMTATGAEYDDQGGASRFFPTFRYEAKAPTAERPRVTKEGAGTGRVTGLGGKVRQCNTCDTKAIGSGNLTLSCGHDDYRWVEPTRDSSDIVAHPTVKPLDLMRWLVRLVTPPGGTVLDPFAGSGATAEACVIEGFRCIAIEREADYLPLIVARLSKPLQVGFDFDSEVIA